MKFLVIFFICPPSLCNYVKETLALKSNKIIHNFFYVLAGIRELYTKKQNANTVWNSNKFLLEIKSTSVFLMAFPNILVRKIKPLIVGEWCVWILVFHSFSGCISQQATRTFTKNSHWIIMTRCLDKTFQAKMEKIKKMLIKLIPKKTEKKMWRGNGMKWEIAKLRCICLFFFYGSKFQTEWPPIIPSEW